MAAIAPSPCDYVSAASAAETTGDRFRILHEEYSKSRPVLTQFRDAIEVKKRVVEDRCNEIQKGRVIATAEEVTTECEASIRAFPALKKTAQQAATLENALLTLGISYLDRPPSDAQTMESIKRDSPELLEKITKLFESRATKLAELRQAHGHICNLRETMDVRLALLEKWLRTFSAIVDNKGKPLTLAAWYSSSTYAMHKLPEDLASADTPNSDGRQIEDWTEVEKLADDQEAPAGSTPPDGKATDGGRQMAGADGSP